MLKFMQAGKQRRPVLYYLEEFAYSRWVLVVRSSGRIDRTLFADDTLSQFRLHLCNFEKAIVFD